MTLRFVDVGKPGNAIHRIACAAGPVLYLGLQASDAEHNPAMLAGTGAIAALRNAAINQKI